LAWLSGVGMALDYPRKSGGLAWHRHKAEGAGVCPRLAEARWARLDFAKKLSNLRGGSLRVCEESALNRNLFVGGYGAASACA
jgi:hypothetical protein